MINTIMNDPIVVTNLRLPRSDWLEIKTIASEQGMSFNQYVRSLIRNMGSAQELIGTWTSPTKRRTGKNIWDLPELAKMKRKPMGLSPDDDLIYED